MTKEKIETQPEQLWLEIAYQAKRIDALEFDDEIDRRWGEC